MKESEKIILVVGAGAVGGYFGACIARSGRRVIFLVKENYINLLKEKKIRIKSVNGDFSVDAEFITDCKSAGVVDLILFCVKSYDTESAIISTIPAIGENTVIVSLQNGVDNEEKIGKIAGMEKVIGGVAYIGARLLQPGIIEHSAAGRVAIGELDGTITERVKEIGSLFENAGVPCEISRNIKTILWKKLMWNAAFNPITALTGCTIKEVMDNPLSRELVRDVMKEVSCVAKYEGVEITDSDIDDAIRFSEGIGHVKTSMLHDIEGGKRLEIEALNGTVVKIGKTHGLNVPLNRTLYECLSLIDLKRRHKDQSF